MDLSIAAQSEALGSLIEEHKEDIKKAEVVQKERKKKVEEIKKLISK